MVSSSSLLFPVPAVLLAKTEKVCVWQSREASSLKMTKVSLVVFEMLKERPEMEG